MVTSLEKPIITTKSAVHGSEFQSLDDAFQNLDKPTLKALAHRLASYYRPINRY